MRSTTYTPGYLNIEARRLMGEVCQRDKVGHKPRLQSWEIRITDDGNVALVVHYTTAESRLGPIPSLTAAEAI